jgi:hypothetical protein
MEDKKRLEDATSKETVEDLEDDVSLETDDTDNTDGPSPDGAFDEDDELKKADPT